MFPIVVAAIGMSGIVGPMGTSQSNYGSFLFAEKTVRGDIYFDRLGQFAFSKLDHRNPSIIFQHHTGVYRSGNKIRCIEWDGLISWPSGFHTLFDLFFNGTL